MRGLRRAIERHVSTAWGGPCADLGRRCAGPPSGGVRLRLTVGRDGAVAAFRLPRSHGAGEALSLADRVGALFRGHRIGAVGFGAPSVDLDGRGRHGFRVVVTVPFRREPAS